MRTIIRYLCFYFDIINHIFSYRQGVYRYKKGTTAVLKTTQKKLEFEVVRTTVRAEPMET